jgi:hypothetical protein
MTSINFFNSTGGIMNNNLTVFENYKIRRVYDEATETWYFSVVDPNIIHQEWADVSVKEHKEIKGLKTQNLRDHMSEAELIFTALAELSTRQIAETELNLI